MAPEPASETHPEDITDTYEIGETLGTGHFSKVKLGIHKETGMKVAIKVSQRSQGAGLTGQAGAGRSNPASPPLFAAGQTGAGLPDLETAPFACARAWWMATCEWLARARLGLTAPLSPPNNSCGLPGNAAIASSHPRGVPSPLSPK